MKLKLLGFSLIEVLISLLLLSLILLGFDAAEIYSLRKTCEAYHISVAVNQLSAMSERLRALGNNAGLEQQIFLWNEENQQLLPNGRGIVSLSSEIKITWGKNQWLAEKIEPAASV